MIRSGVAALTLLILLAAAPIARAQTQPAGPAQPVADQQAQTDNSIGSVATLTGGTALVTRNNSASPLKVGDSIFLKDFIETGRGTTLAITFDDETTFTLTANARLTIDDFVYQPGGAKNSAIFNVTRGTAAFVAAQVAKTGDMKIATPTATLGIRGTSGLVEVPDNVGQPGGREVAIKLYQDAGGTVGRIEVFGRDGASLGILSRAATAFAIRPGAGGRFLAAPLVLNAQQIARDRGLVARVVSAQGIGRQFNIQRQQFRLPGGARPGLQQRPGLPQRPGVAPQPGQQLRPNLPQRPGLQQQPNLQPRRGVPGAPAQPGQGALPRPATLPGQPGFPTTARPPGPSVPTPSGTPALARPPGGSVMPGPSGTPVLARPPGTPQPVPIGPAPAIQRAPGLPGAPLLQRIPGLQQLPGVRTPPAVRTLPAATGAPIKPAPVKPVPRRVPPLPEQTR